MFHRLYGSIHPYDRKRAANKKAVQPLDRPPAYVILPMSMHMGEPCKPTVAVGDHVLLGQQIAEPDGPGAPIHASVSGEVKAIEPRPHPDGGEVLSVVIQNDFLDDPAPALERKSAPEDLTGWEAAELIDRAGIVGLGGGGCPTAAKLKNAIGKADTLIINGVECEPYITADHRLMLEEGERLLGGVRILMRALGLQKAAIAVEANKLDAVNHLRALLGEDSGIRVAALRAGYPQGAEKLLIQRLTGRQVPPGKQPADVKCAVFNVSTAAAVYDAVHDGLPLIRRVVTVSGGAVAEPRNLLVPIGTPLEHLLEECGKLVSEPVRVLTGGPMMGVVQNDLSAPVIKGTNALLALTRRECARDLKKEQPCIRCGRCVRACPMNLSPLFLNLYSRNFRQKALEEYHLTDCIECGSCAYVCPARIPLVRSIRTAKNEVRRLEQLEETPRIRAEEREREERQ